MKMFDYKIRSSAARVSAWLIAETNQMWLFDYSASDDAQLATRPVHKRPDEKYPFFRFSLDGTLSGSYLKGEELVHWERPELGLVYVEVRELEPDLVEVIAFASQDEQHLTFPYGIEKYVMDLQLRFLTVFEKVLDLQNGVPMANYLNDDKPVEWDKREPTNYVDPATSASNVKMGDEYYWVQRDKVPPVPANAWRPNGQPPQTRGEKMAAIKAWDDLDRDNRPLLADWLESSFGTRPDGSLAVPESTFGTWRKMRPANP